MSYPPRRSDLVSIFRTVSNHRLLLITVVVTLALTGLVVSRSAAFRASFAGSATPSAIVRHESSSPVSAKKSNDLLEFAGLRHTAKAVGMTALLAPTVTASKTDSLFTDVDGDLQADPGDTLQYTVKIDAAGEDATGVSFSDTVDPNTAFVPGSLTATPVAVDDSYAATGNVRISVPAPGVLGNDFVGVPAATITAPSTSTNGGDVTVNANGSFTYNPPAGFEGTDTFIYTLTNGTGSNPATVTIAVSGMIWFINNNPGACVSGCDGRLTNPFTSLGAFAAVNNGAGNNPAANDNIFLYESAIDYVGPVTLLSGQRFLGQDATASLSAMTGITPPTYSDPFPATNSGNGVIVNITSAGNSINVASGNTLRGFTGGNSASDINGTGFGTLTISDVTLNGTGQALDLTTGTLAATFGSISSANSSTTGISLTSVAGSLTSPTTTITNPTGIGISVGTSSATLNFGSTTSSGSGATGVSLTTNTGTLNFGSLDISPDANQRGLLATENSNTITTTGGAISASGNVAVEITRSVGTTPLAVSQTSVSANGGTNGIVLTNTSGSFTVVGDGTNTNNSSGGTIQNTTAAGISLTNSQNLSFTAMNIQNILRSGIDGQGVINFVLAFSTINNVGTAAAGQYEESNIAFNDNGAFTNANLTGLVSITNNTLTNARRHGIQIENGSGTISNLTISGNTLTSSTVAATSLGTAILVLQQGSAATTSHLTTGTISNNTVNNFPSGEGIAILGGSGNAGNLTPATLGASGTPIAITSNTVNGGATRMGSNAIRVAFNGQFGSSNFNISCNGSTNAGAGCSATGPLTNYQGLGISAFFGGTVTGTTTINNNILVSNQTIGAGSAGIGVQADDGPAATGTADPDVNVTINNNSVSANEGNGIRAIARATNRATMDLTIQNNTVAAPTLTNRNGIRVDSGSAAGDTNICLSITGNTSAGSGISQGIGIRKQGTNALVNVYGIVGLSPSPTTGLNAAAKVAADNPAGGGAESLSGNNYVNCAQSLLMASTGEESMRMENPKPYDVKSADTLRAHQGEAVAGDDVQKISQRELTWMAGQAIQRWKEAGISAEDFMRLQSMTFEVADLPDGQLARATSTHFWIDETAAGYGWYLDLSAADDTEFDVPVSGRELQTTENSPAFGRMDLLTVVMRELGVSYREGKKSLPKQMLRLMDSTLSPAVRRLPDSRNIQLRRPEISRANQPGSEKIAGSSAKKASALRSKTGVSTSPLAGTTARQNGRLMNHAVRNRTTPATLSSMLADVMLSIGTLPAGESVTITFNVTVDDPFTGAMAQVSNQGTVSGSNFADVLTDDPTVGGTADPTVTPIDLPDVSVAVSPTSVLEDGATNLVYTFTRNGSTAAAMTVNFSVGGTASFTEPDYTQTGAATFTATSGTVVFAAGSSTATVTVDPSFDLTVEPDETVVLTVTSGIGYSVGTPSAATGTITNDDTSVSVAVSPGSVAEDGATNLVYTFTRNGVISAPLAVNFTVGGTATFGASPNDYTQTGATAFAPGAGIVTFTAGSATATVTVDPEADTTVEPDETVDLTVTVGVGYSVGAPASASGTITNDDTDVSVAVSPGSVAEDGATNLVYTFTRSGVTTGALTVNFSVGGSASFPGDYSQSGATTYTSSSGTVTFAAGSPTAIVTIDPTADITVETDETVDLTVTAGAGYNVGTPASVSGTITNDDTTVSVAVSPGAVAEDGATDLVYTFTRTGVTSGALTVNFAVGGTASFPGDYLQSGATTFTPPTGTVTFGAGNSTATLTIDPTADSTVELNETVDIAVTAGAGYIVGSPSAASGTIINDDTDVTLAVSPGAVAEDGATNLVYTFSRTGVTSSALTVNFTVGGTASFPGDYSQSGATTFTPPTGTVTFGAGNSTATVTIDPVADSTVELDETVDLTLAPGAGYNVGSPSAASGTITNDDTDVTLAVSPGAVAEDGATNLVYTFSRNGVTTSALTVNFTVGGTASFPGDYSQSGATSFTPPTGTVTFAPGSPTATVTIDPVADSTVELDETVDLTLAPGAGYNVGSPSAASGTITNDDTDVTLAVSPGSVAEDGATNLVYTFSRSGVTSNALTVNFSVGGTASFPGDYSQSGATTYSSSAGTVTFAPGSSTATVTIDPTTDSTVELDETVDITLTAGAGYNVGSPSAASGTITNDDTDVSIAVAPASVAEDGATNLVYTFTRNGVTSGPLTVNFSVGGTATFGASPNDYTQTGATSFTPPTGTVTFTAGSSTATVTVNPETDTTIEADETVILTLTSGTGYNVSSPSSAMGTITNDDADVSVAVAPASVAEDGATNLVYTFSRTGFTSGALTVNFSVGGTAVFGPSPDDYTQTGATTYTTTSGSVTFAPGSPTATVTVDPETDLTVEADETVVITLTAGASYNAVSPNSATGTILNDDTLVSVVVAPSSTAEGGANLVYSFTRTGPTASALTVNFSVGGSASFPADYTQSGSTTFTPPTATVTFGVGSSTATVTVTPLTDCVVEGNETVEFTVQPGAGYGVGSPNMATGTITNTPDSSSPTITLIPNVNMTLWPPNHQYESIAVTDFVASASDNCDPTVNVNSVYIVQITSDEAEDGNGDGNTLNDIVIGADCKTAQLRSERSTTGNGRVYSLTFKVKDSEGNFATATTTVTVRKSPNQPAVDSGTQYVVNSICP
ncbi:MAG: Calx-beta domain-containing protein [Acidobacteriota bacterium]